MPCKLTLQRASILLLVGSLGCSSDQTVKSGTDSGGDGTATGGTDATHSTSAAGTLTASAGGTGSTSVATAATGANSTGDTLTSGATTASASSGGGATSGTVTAGASGNQTTAGIGGATGGAGGASSSTGAATGPSPESIVIQDNFDAVVAGMPPDTELWEGYPQGQESLAPVVDSARAKSGSNAARVTSTSSGLGSFLVPKAAGLLGGEAVPGNAFYVRVHMNWQKATTEVSGHSAFIVGAASRDNSGTEARLGISSKGPGNVPRVDLNLQSPSDGAGGEVTRYSNGFTDGGNPADFTDVGFQFAADTWYCVEAFFDGTTTAAEFRLWVDGTEIEEMHVTDFSANGTGRTSWGPSYQYIKIGAQDYDANLGQIWYDDVVVATEPIGCAYNVP